MSDETNVLEEEVIAQEEQDTSPEVKEPSLEQQLQEMKDQLLRQMAETENVRKRAEREKEETARYAVTKFARDLLEVSDNLSRALEACQGAEASLEEQGKSLLEGVSLTQKTLFSTFERYHIRRLDPMGEKFDPNHHQAMFETESEEVAPGTVTAVLQPGYVLHDRLLRPAMVGVAKKKS